MRRAFLNRVADMICNEADTTFFTVDIGMWAIRDVLRDFPDRCMNVGIYEDGMFSIAAGMARRGLVPTIFGIQPYLVERTLEQIKMDLAYQKLGVNVVGTGAAVDYPKYGYSHYCAEDAAVVKLIPSIEFVTPGSSKQMLQLFNQSYRNGNTTIFRISDHPNIEYDPDVEFGRAIVMQQGSKATVIATGVMLDTVMQACTGRDVTVLYYTTLEPFDHETLICNCETRKILLCSQFYEGTLLLDVHKALAGSALMIEEVAFPREIFRNYGTYDEKLEYYGLTYQNIRKKLDKLITA